MIETSTLVNVCVISVKLSTKDIVMSIIDIMNTKYGYTINENDKAYQKITQKDNNICGRIAILRTMNRFLDNHDFNRAMEQKLNINNPIDKFLSFTCLLDLRDICLRYIQKSKEVEMNTELR